MRRAVRLGAAVLAVALLAGCSTTAADLPLPGSSLRGESYEVTAQIDDALNLAVGAPVKLDGVTVGRVSTVTARDFTARIAMDVLETVTLHAGATIRLRSTTPLGELFVDVVDTEEGAVLRDGDAITAGDASAAPTVEDTLASASMLINGGGLGQLETIVREANEALGGREGAARELLGRLARTTGTFNDSSDEIDATLDALAEVSTILRDRDETIDQALVDVAPAARVLSRESDDLARLLRSVDDLGDTTTRVIRATRDDLISTLEDLGPVLDELVSLKGDFGQGLDDLVALAEAIDTGVPGDYLNVALLFQPEVSIGVPSLPLVDGLVDAPAAEPEAAAGDGLLDPVEDVLGLDDDTGLGLGGLLDLLGGGKK